jgi:hypothetical protein
MNTPGRLSASALLALWHTVAVACGFFVHEGQYRVFLLRPEVAGFHELSPYYFTTNALFESEITYDASQRPGQRRNVAEWQAYVGVAVPLKDIEEALYGLDPMTFWDDFDRLRNENAFVKHLAERDTLALAYLRYARRCEKLVNYDDPWRLDGWDMDGIARAQAFGHALWAKAPSDFLKGRIGYQLIRLEYYGGWLSADTLQALYSKRVMPYAKTSWIDASARYYVAERMADGPVRLYALSRVFDEGLDKRSRIVSLFPKDSLDAILALARTDHERAVIAVLSAIHRRGRALKQLEGIQSLDPTNSFLPFLLVREVNKVEDWLMTPVLTEYLPASRSEWWSLKYDEPRPPQIARSVDLAYAQELHRFLHTALKDCAPEQRATLELIAAHLSFVTGNLDDAEEHLAQAEGLPVKQRSHLAAQLAMERVLLHFARTPKLDAAIEQAIMTVDRALDTGDDVLAGRVMRDQLHLYIARRLMENGDVARGIYMLSHTDRAYGDTYWNTKTPYLELLEKGSPADIDRMIALLDKPHKTPFESWLTGGKVWQATGDWSAESLPIRREKLLDYKSMWYVNHDRLEEAIATLEQVPDSFWMTFPYTLFAKEDPFRVNVSDLHNGAKQDRRFFSKRTYLAEILRLKREAATDPAKAALDNYLLGNAYFNMSWHGKYWIMCDVAWSSDEEIFTDGKSAAFKAHYYGLARAKPYYLKAMRQAKDPALKALACYMAAFCDHPRDPQEAHRRNRLLKELHKGPEREAYEGIVECTLYEDFIGRYR